MTTSLPVENDSAFLQRIRLQFSDRPNFEEVVKELLELAILEKYPSLAVDFSKLMLATPDATAKRYHLRPFMPLVLDYLALGTPIDFAAKGTLEPFLSDDAPRRLRAGDERVDIKIIEQAVQDLSWTVPIALHEALNSYWHTAVNGSSTIDYSGSSRLRWLSDMLRNMLRIHSLRQPGLSDHARKALSQVIECPTYDMRVRHDRQAPVQAYQLATVMTSAAGRSVSSSSAILLVHTQEERTIYLLCRPGGAVECFTSIEAFNSYWGGLIAGQFDVDTVTCQRHELLKHVFEFQAALILNQQVENIQAVKLPSRIGLQNLTALYQELSDPTQHIVDAPTLAHDTVTRVEPLLPQWVKGASFTNQRKFQRYSLALASAIKNAQGRTFLSDIEDIKAYTVTALLADMSRTNSDSPTKAQTDQFQPDDIELTFTVAAGYPGTVGIVEHRKMSLTELAIANLVSKPSGQLKLSHRLGLELPHWLTPDFITRTQGLIERVDIGTNYPRYLQQNLFDDVLQRQERQRVFAAQMAAQLPLTALKQALLNENGLTVEGVQLIEGLLGADSEDQHIGGACVVIRHLALLRTPRAQPDIVSNMFIIEPQDINTGPHVLYRPLYAVSLQQFATRAALLQSITASGELQDSVLACLADDARPIYINGGFLEPRILQFAGLDDFSFPMRPAPATLAVNEGNGELLQFLHNGELMQYLYGSQARSLITQAERDSVSNSESRWAIFKQGASILFNILIFPFLRGPFMATAWLWALIISARQDIPALSSDDPVKRELAVVDLLLNLGMLALQAPSVIKSSYTPLPEALKNQAIRSPAPRLVPERWPVLEAPAIAELPVVLSEPDLKVPSSEPRLPYPTFSFFEPRKLTNEEHIALQKVEVPYPETLPAPLTDPFHKGLYLIDDKLHAMVDGRLYRIILDASERMSDDRATIVDPHDPTKRLHTLRQDAQGNWSIDLRRRLAGGMAPKSIAEAKQRKAARVAELKKQYQEYVDRQGVMEHRLSTLGDLVKAQFEDSKYTEADRGRYRAQLYKLLEEETPRMEKLLESVEELERLGSAPNSEAKYALMSNIVRNARKAFTTVRYELEAHLEANGQFKGPDNVAAALRTNPAAYFDFLQKAAEINGRMIDWLKLADSYLERLFNLGTKGQEMYVKLTRDRANEPTVLGCQALQLSLLNPLIYDDNFAVQVRDNYSLLPLLKQIRTHSELNTASFSSAERLELLESLGEHYGRELEHLDLVKALYDSHINQTYFKQQYALIEGFYQDVSSQLAAQIRPEPQASRKPAKPRWTAPGGRQKKVIRTEKGVLVGDLLPAANAQSQDVVELRSENDRQLLGTYSRQGDVWTPMDEAKPVIATAPSTRAVNILKEKAQTLLEELPKRMTAAEGYRKRCRFPQEIEEIMNGEAKRFQAISEELDGAFGASQTARAPADQQLIKELNAAALRLKSSGEHLRIELSIELPPTDAALQYLLGKKRVEILPPKARIKLKGERKDYMQEYRINDSDGNPIWCAHFHYEKADAPSTNYSVAHLKTWGERLENYHSALARASSHYAVVDVHRGTLSKLTAKRWFLPLADKPT